MESPDVFTERLKRIKHASGVKTDAELAEVLGIKPSSVAGAKQRKQIPTGWIEKVATKFGASTDWLFFGSEPTPEEGRGAASVTALEEGGEYAALPLAEARLAPGTGALGVVEGASAQYAFRREWLSSKGKPESMVVMAMTGDSMAPEIRDRDLLLVDQSQTQIIVGGIYAVGFDEAVLIKYVDREPGKYLFRVGNPNYSALAVGSDQLGQTMRFIGRVIWWCRDVK